jgi:hypothetical protein
MRLNRKADMNKPPTGKAELIGLAKEHVELLKQCLAFSAELIGETLTAFSRINGMNVDTTKDCITQIISDTPSCVMPETISVEQWQLSDLQGEVSHWAIVSADGLASIAHSCKSPCSERYSPKLRRSKAELVSTIQQLKLRLDMKRDQLGDRAKFTTDSLSRTIAALEGLPVTHDLRSVEHLVRSIPDLAGLTLILAAPYAEVDAASVLPNEFTEPLPVSFLCTVFSKSPNSPLDSATFRKRVKNGTYIVHPEDCTGNRRKLRIWLDHLPSNLRRSKDRSEAVAAYEEQRAAVRAKSQRTR